MIRSRQALRVVTEALRPGAGGPEAAESRAREGVWLAALALANEHYLGPALYSSLSAAGRLADLPEEVRAYLELLHDSNRLRNERLRRQAEGVVGALNAAGIVPLLLKGSLALFLNHYPDQAARMIRDLDVLVPKDRLDEALGALKGRGYRTVARYPAGHHAYGDLAKTGEPGAVDLHLELIDSPYLLPARTVWRRARLVKLPRLEFFVPSPTDCLLHNFLHGQIHHVGNHYRGVIELRQLYDFVVLARHHGAEIDWSCLTEHLTQHRLEGPLQSYGLAAEQLFAFPWRLPSRPSLAARLHYRRCALQLCFPGLARVGLPFANLHGAFARHRMDGLYADRSSLLRRRLRHARRFLCKSTLRGTMERLFKVR